MANKKRSEISFEIQSVLPYLTEHYGYPDLRDDKHVKICEIPVRLGSGVKKPDVVYYWDDVPVVLLEAKKPDKSEEDAKDQSLSYVRNYPKDKREYSKDGRRPRFIIVAKGKEINFYVHNYKLDGEDYKDWLEKADNIIPFKEVLERYGLLVGYKPKILSKDSFRKDFLDELMAIYNTDKDRKITKDVIKNVAHQILSYLEEPNDYMSRKPYVSLDGHKDRQSEIRQLFKQYDIINSLNPDNAKEFRSFAIRSFQGAELNQYMTEQCIIAFMTDLVDIQPNWKVMDFECGSGGYLASVLDKGRLPLENIKGIDIDELPYIISKTYLAIYFGIYGKEKINAMPVLCDNGLFNYGSGWDLIIGNPAGSNQYEKDDIGKVLKYLDSDIDLNGRDDVFSEYNFSVQQAVKSTKLGGKICLILPEGLFSNSQDDFLRRYIVKYCKIFGIVSLPRGVFKKGRDTAHAQRGQQVASMKMSILCAEKTREVKRGDGIDLKGIDLNYSVFMASIDSPEARDEKTKGISNWLEPRLAIVLKQWKNWQTTHNLIDAGCIKSESRQGVLGIKVSKAVISKKTVIKVVEAPILKKEIKAKTKISQQLKDLFKKRN
ncbi:MAG: N-6 DNA methylase [Candidatus Firestonebacteria bacterium]